jgi:oxalate decarboxylase/phosphoglucose isomerase-like protein (cupin superfamily)
MSGAGTATVSGRRHLLRRGSLILIERGETHEIRNTGRRPLRTLNFYVPPAYSVNGDSLPRGRRRVRRSPNRLRLGTTLAAANSYESQHRKTRRKDCHA